MRKRILATALSVASFFSVSAQTAYDYDALQMESLGRGVIAVRQSESQVFVSWRCLRTDPDGQGFNIYRNGRKLNDSPVTDVSYFMDRYSGNEAATYRIRPAGIFRNLLKRHGIASGSYTLKADAPIGYLPIPVDVPGSLQMPDGEMATYTPNDCSVGDVDGDGEYEIILKWDPSNSRDNAHSGYSGNVYVDCLRLDGERLWRIDLGRNIRAGAHYTQFMVYDLDGDGKAELVMKTSDGSIDGTGKVIGNADADYRETDGKMKGRIMSGNEYLTVFNGMTGAAMQTIPYIPGRGDYQADWGDNYANRGERYLAAVAYLDGVHPSVVMCRGYYTRTSLAAYGWDGHQLTQQWVFDTKGHPELKAYEGQGNHNLRVADVDGDGCDEIIYGACVIDHNGKGLYSTGKGHGDSMHLGHFIEGNEGLQVWIGHEGSQCSTLRDARTGQILLDIPAGKDVGRSMAADIDPTTPGAEMWSSGTGGILDSKGERIATATCSTNFAVWWDGDLSRELLDGNYVEKYNPESRRFNRIATFTGAVSNNGTKSTPCLSADLLGDWREEILLRSNDNTELRLYISTAGTGYRFPTLMQNAVYRLSVATENVAYNQPPEPDGL